jgi:hypothetical protein
VGTFEKFLAYLARNSTRVVQTHNDQRYGPSGRIRHNVIACAAGAIGMMSDGKRK